MKGSIKTIFTVFATTACALHGMEQEPPRKLPKPTEFIFHLEWLGLGAKIHRKQQLRMERDTAKTLLSLTKQIAQKQHVFIQEHPEKKYKK